MVQLPSAAVAVWLMVIQPWAVRAWTSRPTPLGGAPSGKTSRPVTTAGALLGYALAGQPDAQPGVEALAAGAGAQRGQLVVQGVARAAGGAAVAVAGDALEA